MIANSIFLTTLLLTASGEFDESSRELEARWRREYPPAAEKWEALSREFVAKGRYSFHWFDGETVVTKDLTVASSGDKKLFIQDGVTTVTPDAPDATTESCVQCQTPEFMFKLTKMPPSDQYLIDFFQKLDDDENSDFNEAFRIFARGATVFSGWSVLEIMRDPTFLMKSIGLVQRDGVEVVRIAYTRERKHDFESGTFDLDPAMGWAIRGGEATFTDKKKSIPSSHSLKVDYKKVDDTHFFPVRREFFDRRQNPKFYQHGVLELDQVTLGRPSDRLFKLSAYGIPDLPLRPSPRSSAFTFRNPILWLALAATVACFASLWFLRSRDARTT